MAVSMPPLIEWPPLDRDASAEANELKELRKSLHWSADRTARLLGCSKSTYARWEIALPLHGWPALLVMRDWAAAKGVVRGRSRPTRPKR
jgi:hypothetical protein